MKKQKTARKKRQPEQFAEREAILEERNDLQKRLPAAYSPQIGVFTPDKVEVMLTVSRSQAENLARLLKEHKL